VFRQTLPTLKLKKGVKYEKLINLCYLSVGMVLNSNEKKNKGAFTIDDLLTDSPDPIHSAPFVSGKNLGNYGVIDVQFLEYGNGSRVPSHIRRPTFPELYDRPKLMIARFGGICFDDGRWDGGGFLKCNHTVMLLMPWHLLSSVHNRSIFSQMGNRNRQSLELLSKTADPWYLLGFLNSPQIREFLSSVSRSAISIEVQPDDLREILVPLPTQTVSDEIAQLAREATDCQRALLPYRRSGWKINGNGIEPIFNVPTGITTLALGRAKVRWNLRIVTPTAKLIRLERQDRRIVAGRAVAIEADDTIPEEALNWLTGQLRQCGLYALDAAEQAGLLIPATPRDAEQAWSILQGERANIVALLDRIAAIKVEMAARLDGLFARMQHPVKRLVVL
jgi:hypothetical protein